MVVNTTTTSQHDPQVLKAVAMWNSSPKLTARYDAHTQLSSTMTIRTALLARAAVDQIAWVPVEVPVARFGLKYSTALSLLHITTP